MMIDDDSSEATIASTREMMTDAPRVKRPKTSRAPRPRYIGTLTFNDNLVSTRQRRHAIEALVQMLGVSTEQAAGIVNSHADANDSSAFVFNNNGERCLRLMLNVAQVGALHAQFTRHEKWVGIVNLTELQTASTVIDVSSKRGASF